LRIYENGRFFTFSTYLAAQSLTCSLVNLLAYLPTYLFPAYYITLNKHSYDCRLDFFTDQHYFIPRCAFFPTTTATYNASIMVLSIKIHVLKYGAHIFMSESCIPSELNELHELHELQSTFYAVLYLHCCIPIRYEAY